MLVVKVQGLGIFTGLGFGVWGLGFGVGGWGSGFRVQCMGPWFWGVGVWGLGFVFAARFRD